jgi:hypothetical protein
MEAEHKVHHPGFKVRNLAKVVGCPFPLLPPVSDEFIRLNQNILDTVPELDPKSVSGGGGAARGVRSRLPRAYSRATSLGSSFRMSIRAPVRGGEPFFYVEGPDPDGNHAVDMAPASDAVADLRAQVKSLEAKLKSLSSRTAIAQRDPPAFGTQSQHPPAATGRTGDSGRHGDSSRRGGKGKGRATGGEADPADVATGAGTPEDCRGSSSVPQPNGPTGF